MHVNGPPAVCNLQSQLNVGLVRTSQWYTIGKCSACIAKQASRLDHQALQYVQHCLSVEVLGAS